MKVKSLSRVRLFATPSKNRHWGGLTGVLPQGQRRLDLDPEGDPGCS